MSETNFVGAASAASAPAAEKPSSSAAAQASADFDSFLQLLTAQLRYQDPLAPTDSTQFVEQLATFSALEQQIQTNDKLDALADALGGGDLDTAVAWIGKDVAFPGASAVLDGSPLSFRVAPEPDADRATVRVINETGAVVASFDLDVGATSGTWDGRRDDGSRAAGGEYRFTVDYYKDDARLAEREASAFTRVSEVRLDAGAPVLVTGGGRTVTPASVEAVREAPGSEILPEDA